MNLNTEFDTRLFIEEVRARPAIWDSESPDYVNRHLKNRCWDEVCAAMHPGFEDVEGRIKEQIARSLRRRWRSLRDCYTRELNTQTIKSRKTTQIKNNKHKQYVFFEYLHFIRPSVEKRTTRYNEAGDKDHTSNNHDSDEVSNEEEPMIDFPIEIVNCKIEDPYLEYIEQNQPLVPSKTTKENISKRKAGDETQGDSKRFEIDPPFQSIFPCANTLSHDQDWLFMFSLLDDFKKVHASHRLDLKCDIINAIKKWSNTPPK